MSFTATIQSERFVFRDLVDLFAKANEEKSGDQLAGIAATSERERVAAKIALADVPLREIADAPLIEDDVTDLIASSFDRTSFDSRLAPLTVGEFRERLLAADEADVRAIGRAITPEMAAAVTKLMGNKDLITVASRIRNVTRCRNTLGERGVFAVRIQPNHPSDDLPSILLATIDGLLFGCGDAVIGVNPAAESVDTAAEILHGLNRLIETLRIPTQACCLAHISTQLAALDRGAPIDLLFQSIAGTTAANASFGVTLAQLREGRQRVLEHHDQRRDSSPSTPFAGNNVMYFETGQGSALSADAHHGVDQLTLEARAYGIARVFEPHLVNSVVGFIGPEYLFDERQITRAGLEDHFMGKLLGLPMGVDVCYTNHASADQNTADNLLILLAAAGVNYVMGVPCADDVMLNYQSTSFHDGAAVRELLGLRAAPEFAHWLEEFGILRHGRLAHESAPNRRILEAAHGVLAAR
jgi:ethanolamine ammonia-lyase large subunit